MAAMDVCGAWSKKLVLGAWSNRRETQVESQVLGETQNRRLKRCAWCLVLGAWLKKQVESQCAWRFVQPRTKNQEPRTKDQFEIIPAVRRVIGLSEFGPTSEGEFPNRLHVFAGSRPDRQHQILIQ